MPQDCYLIYYMNELAGATFMVFTRTCDNTRKLALMLRNLGFDALPIHGQMNQPKRLGALNKFKAGERSILVATGQPVTQPPQLWERRHIRTLDHRPSSLRCRPLRHTFQSCVIEMGRFLSLCYSSVQVLWGIHLLPS